MRKNIDQSLNNVLKTINFENVVSSVRQDSNEYYNAIDQFGISERLNKIIDNFQEDTINESGIFNKLDLNIGIICDEFLYYSLKDTANFIYLPFTEDLSVNPDVDVLLVVSSWRGLDHSWDYVASPNGRVRAALLTLINLYKEEGIKTVFYSKEDPVSYSHYLSIAQECDYIFTSAKEMIEVYKADTGNDNVDYLEFGINPVYHNPIGKDLVDRKLSNIVTFAGSWMVRFPRRNKEALELFNGVYKSGYSLSIIDRQYERKMERYHFPPHLIKNISETIPHERLMKLHKATKWGINLNSVHDSSTMFANRVYELQAMGNVILSNYNKGIQKKFPNVLMFNKSRDVDTTIRELNLINQKALIAEGIRNVMLKHTSFHRIGKICNMIGIEYETTNPKVLVVGDGENAKASYTRQSYKNINMLTDEEFENDETIKESFDFVVFFSDKINYGEFYIEDLLSTFVYTNVDVVTMNKDNYQYTTRENYIKTSSMIASKSLDRVNKNDEDVLYFNIPRNEISANIEPTDLNSETVESKVTIVVPVKNEEVSLLEYKSLLNIEKVNVNVQVVTYEEISPENENKLLRLKNKSINIKHIHFNNMNNESEALNNTISTLESKYFMILYPGDQISKYNLSNLIYNIDDFQADLIIGKTNNLITSQFSDTEDIYDMDIESSLYSTDFIIGNNIRFDENVSIRNNNFVLTVLSYKPESIRYEGNFTNKLSQDSLFDEIDNITLLEEYKQIEIHKKELLLELQLVEDYTRKLLPELLLDTYIPLFKNCSREEKAHALMILEDIFTLYSNFYQNEDKNLNNFIDVFL